MPATTSPLSPAHLDVMDMAIEWHCRLSGDETTVEDWLAFEQWLAESNEHANAAQRLDGLLAILPGAGRR